MAIPPKPKPKSPTEFPDPTVHVGIKDLGKSIRKVILDLRSVMTKGDGMETLVDFASVVHPGSFANPGRLPYDLPEGRSYRARKAECIFAMVSKLIQDYWDVALDLENPNPAERIKEVEAQVAKLRLINTEGLHRYKMQGDDKHGYVLA